jgi:hypothetical protein
VVYWGLDTGEPGYFLSEDEREALVGGESRT